MISIFKREIDLYWRFIKNDIWATIIPGLIVTLSSILYNHTAFQNALIIVFEALVYFNLYVYSFTLTNQISSVEEDRINKPYRPLPLGMISRNEMLRRILLAVLLFLFMGFILGVLKWALLWVLTTGFLYFFGHNHWFTKNIISMSLGIFSIIGAAWELVTPMSSQVLILGLIISIVFGCCGVIQDFRDVEGDKLIGRKTLPIDIGDEKARKLSVLICFFSFLSIFIYFFTSVGKSPLTWVYTLFILFFFSIISFRLLSLKDKRSDHLTYMILLYLFNYLLLSFIVFIH